MRVTVIAANETRDRKKFVYQPLQNTSHDLELLLTRPFIGYLGGLFASIFKQKPDVVIFMGVGVKEMIAFLIVGAFKVPFIVRLGGDRLKDLDMVATSQLSALKLISWMKYKLEKLVARFMLSRTRNVIVVNHILGEKIQGQLAPQSRCFVIPQFIEHEGIRVNYDLHQPVELLTVSNLRFSDKADGIIWLINQLDAFVRTFGGKIRFRIAGDGQHLNDIISFINDNELSELLEIELLGYVTDIKEYYSETDVFIYRSEHDATPNVILESKCYGLPLLVNRYDEFLELVENDVNGIVYSSEREFKEKLLLVLSKPEYRKSLGMKALEDFKSRFSIEAASSMLDDMLYEISISSEIS